MESTAGPGSRFGPPPKTHSIPRKPIQKRSTRTEFAPSWHRVAAERHDRQIPEEDEPRNEFRDDDTADADATRRTSPPPQRQSQQRLETKYDQPKTSPTVTVTRDAEKRRFTFDGKWRPSWLRPPVLAAFAGVFLIFTVALAFMLRYSRANNGLIGTQKNYVYAWRLGPTAILTLLAVLWARVELQAMRFMPWIATRRGQLLGRSGYSLDYTSMLSAKALVLSLQNKHYLVFLATTIGFFLKFQIIMAPGLYSLATLGNPAEIDIQISDSFSVDYMAGNTKDTTPYYNARALQHSGMLYPFGASHIAAYQTFNRTGVGRGNATAPVTAVVDGFFSDIQCIKLESHSVMGSSYHNESDGLRSTVDVNLKFQGCEAIIPVVNWKVSQPPEVDNTSKDWTAFGNVNETLATERPCPNLPQQHPQFLYWLGRFERSATNSSRMYLETGAAVLCSPRSWLSKVQVIDDGVNPNVTILPDEPKTAVAANVWKMLLASIPGYLGGTDFVSQSYQKHAWGPLRADQLFWDTRFGLELPDGGENSRLAFASDTLYTSIRNLTQSIGPFLGHHLVRLNDSSTAAGDELVIADKLVINEWVCVTMITLFALVTCLTFFVLVRYRRHTTIWHRSPATLLGNMIFLRDHPAFEESVTESAPRDPMLAWGRSNFNPVVLRPWARACFVLFAGALIGGLIYTLHRSQTLNGLSYVNEEGYWHLLWTSVPALVALVAYSYIKSCDWAFRHLATFYCLAAGPCGTQELDTSLLDMLGVRALYQSVRRRVWMVTFTQLLAIMCGILMTLISILFTVEDVPEPTVVSLTQQTWFGAQPDKAINTTDDYMINRLTIGSLLLRKDEDNFTYPRNTYNDLVFPILEGLDHLEDPQNKSVRLTVPAAQARASCAVFPEGLYTFAWSNHTEGQKTVMGGTIVEPFTCDNSKRTKANFTTALSLSTEAENTGSEVFGKILPSPENYRSTIEVCNLEAEPNFQDTEFFPSRTLTYAIGSWDSRWNQEGSVTIYKCNYTFAKVDTEVNLINIDGEFVIDPKNPPKPDPSTLRSWDPPIELPRDWRLSNVSGIVDPYPDLYVNQSGVSGWDREFRMFATSGTYKIIGPNDEQVVDMLAQKYNFLQAQLLNLEGRVGVYDASKFNPGPGKQPPVEAAVTDDRRRLKQSPAVTYIIVVILGLAAVVNLMALLLGSRGNLFDMDARGLAPNLSNGIESRVELLRGSNAADYLPAGTELLSKEELHGQLSNVSFRMGWFRRADGARIYTVGVLGDDKFVFRGSRRDFETALEGGRRATYDTFASRVGTWKKSATFATKVRQNSF